MMMIPTEFIPLAAALPVVIASAWTDLRMMRIPNPLVLVGLVVFVLTLPFLDAGEALWRGMICGHPTSSCRTTGAGGSSAHLCSSTCLSIIGWVAAPLIGTDGTKPAYCCAVPSPAIFAANRSQMSQHPAAQQPRPML